MLRNIAAGILSISILNLVHADLGVIFGGIDSVSEEDSHYCIIYNQHFAKLPQDLDKAPVYRLKDLTRTKGCNDSDGYSTQATKNTFVAVSRGDCTFSEKAYLAQKHGYSGLLIVDNYTALISPGANNKTDYNLIHIPVASIQEKDLHSLMISGDALRVKVISPRLRDTFDPCLVIIFLIAVGCVAVGGYWSGTVRHNRSLRYHQKKTRKGRDTAKERRDKESSEEEEEEESVDVTFPVIVFFVILSSTFLVLLFFFYDYLVYVVIGMFCIAGAVGLFSCLLPVWTYLPIKARLPPNKVPCFTHRPEYKNIVLFSLCLGVSIFWAIQRHKSYAWVIQDFLGVTFCLNVLKVIQIPNLKICSALLVALFIYDIFFVFITPLITKSGESIMVEVATGGSSSTGEQLPMVFKVPRLTSSALNVCDLPFSLLGFGDIIIPGLLVGFNYAIDLKVQSKNVYFISTVIGYGVGLIITFGALYIMETGQPALLYLVPCTLVTTMVIGCCRGEFKLLWNGDKKCPKKDDDADVRDRPEREAKTSDKGVNSDNISVTLSTSSSGSEGRQLLPT